jgi:hypothetical protein
MATTLSFGYVKPATGDKGAVVFTPLESNIQQVNDHKHNGSNSDRVDSSNLQREVVNVTAAGWAADGELFKKTVTFPAGFTASNGSEYGKASIRFFFDGGTLDKNELFPKTVRLTDTTFELHSPVSSQAFNVTFV